LQAFFRKNTATRANRRKKKSLSFHIKGDDSGFPCPQWAQEGVRQWVT
jgi:hypothetical protein